MNKKNNRPPKPKYLPSPPAGKFASPQPIAIGAVPDGKVVDFITGSFFNDTAEEYVRQNIEKALVRQYKYLASDCSPEFRIKMGSAKPRVDIVVFGTGQSHEQTNAYILVETKKPGTNRQNKEDGIGQLQSYLAASPNARFGLWTNGDDRVCFARREKGGRIYCEEIPDISVSIRGIRGQRGYAIVPIRVH